MDRIAAGSGNFLALLFPPNGFFIGGLLGAKVAVHIPTELLQKIFAVVMMAIGAYMFFVKK